MKEQVFPYLPLPGKIPPPLVLTANYEKISIFKIFEQSADCSVANNCGLMCNIVVSGYPVITVEKTDEDGNYRLSQSKFGTNGSSETSPYKYKWEVPISFKTSEDSVKRTWLHLEDESITM